MQCNTSDYWIGCFERLLELRRRAALLCSVRDPGGRRDVPARARCDWSQPVEIYMSGTLVDDKLPAAGQEVPFSSLAAARECQERVYRSGLDARRRADGEGMNLRWETRTQAGEYDAQEFIELCDSACDVEDRTGFYVRTVRVFGTPQEFDETHREGLD
jgi:hypothetical protein